MTWILSVLWGSMAAMGFGGWPPPPDRPVGTLTITIAPKFAGQPLALGQTLYATAAGDSLYLDLFRCYLSAIQLQGEDLNYTEKDSYHLIDAEDSSTLTIVLKNVPAGKYQALRFNIGIDSLTNVSGAMGGDLDPSLGMYWAWNSGYINVKLEGRSKACPTLRHAFGFHIGGYLPPNQTVRRIVLPLNNVVVAKNESRTVQLDADLARFFSHVNLRTTNEVMIPSKPAAQLADYFKGVFSME